MKFLKKNRKKIFFTLFLLLSIFLNTYALDGVKNPLAGKVDGDIDDIIKTMISGLLKLAIPFLVLAYIYVGFLFVKAQGAAAKLQEARKALIWVVVGTIIIIGANTIYSIIEDTLKEANIKTVRVENRIIYN